MGIGSGVGGLQLKLIDPKMSWGLLIVMTTTFTPTWYPIYAQVSVSPYHPSLNAATIVNVVLTGQIDIKFEDTVGRLDPSGLWEVIGAESGAVGVLEDVPGWWRG